MKKRYLALALASLLGGMALAQDQAALPDLTAAMDDANAWATPSKDFASTRYSTLDQINVDNAGDLELAWSMSTGVLRGHEGQPIVVGDMMYYTTAFPNIVFAIDLNKPTEVLWKYTPENDPGSIGVACCDVVNRGVAYGDGKIFLSTLDGHLDAIDATTGELVWRVKNTDWTKGQALTAAPLVVDDKVYVGVSGGEFGIRGYMTAYNIADGTQAWRWFNTGPDTEVGIEEATFKPFYDQYKEADLGVSTWPTDQWKIGGSSVWAWFSADTELNLIYYGTSNPGTWGSSARRPPELAESIGDQQAKWANLWSTSVIARDLDTGKMVWAYQFTPHDQWDYDAVNEMILHDQEVNGETRKVLTHFDRNGFAYTIDRATGEVLAAPTYGEGVNWASSIDLTTGLPNRNLDKGTVLGRNVTNICPSAMGYKDQQPASYDPESGLFYVPTNNLCMDYEGTESTYIAGVPYVGATVKTYNGPGGHGGSFMAWDPVAGKKVWENKEQFAVWSGSLNTAGGVAFYGTLDGWFKVVNKENGDLLWQFKAGSGIIGNAMTYMGPDGRQYVAILSGVGGWSGLTVAGDLSLDDPTAALGAVNAFADLGRYTQKGGQLYVFALPEDGAQASAN